MNNDLTTKEMIEDYELEDTPCPKCNHYPIHSRSCQNIHCDDGYMDAHEWDDPINLMPGEQMDKCSECNGLGIERWCPSCGYDISANPDNLAIDFSDDMEGGYHG